MERLSDIINGVLSDIRKNIKEDPFMENVCDGVTANIKVENPQPYLNSEPEIPSPVVKKGR